MKRDIFWVGGMFYLFIVFSGFMWTEAGEKIRDGNILFKQGDYDNALVKYNDAQLSDPASPEIFFNMGSVFYRQKKYQEAIDAYQKAMQKGDYDVESKGFYNIGNALVQQGKLREAIDAYKQALERASDDIDTKFNLEYTERKMKEMLSQAQKTKQQAQEEQAKRAQQERQGKAGQTQGSSQGQKEKQGSQQAMQAAGNDEKEGKKEDNVQAQESVDKDKAKEQKSGFTLKKGEKSDTSQSKEAEKAKDISKEEAKRFLNAYDQKQNNFLPMQQQSGSSTRRSYVEKDW